jgi:hypothetical protein
VNAGAARTGERAGSRLDILAIAAGQCGNACIARTLRDLFDACKRNIVGDREAGFDRVDPSLVEQARDLKSSGGRHRSSGRLLAVAQRSIKDLDGFHDGLLEAER